MNQKKAIKDSHSLSKPDNDEGFDRLKTTEAFKRKTGESFMFNSPPTTTTNLPPDKNILVNRLAFKLLTQN